MNLPDQVRNETAIRMRMTKLRPFLEAQNFHHELRILLEAVIGCKSSSDTRQSHDYPQYEHHAYQRIAAFSSVIEPQQDGRLHWHIMLHSSVMSAELLEKAAAAPTKLQTQVAEMLDSITCTTLPPDIHRWYNDTIATIQYGTKRPRAADMDIPDASSDYIVFLHIGMKKSLLTGMHGHGFCCEKGKKGEIHVWFSLQAKTS